MSHKIQAYGSLTALIAVAALSCSSARAEPLFAFLTPPAQSQIAPQPQAVQPADPADDEDVQLPARLKKQIVGYQSAEAPGTVIVDTSNTYLYYVLGGGKALRYGIGVGREGFTWSGVRSVARKAEWPDWYPPSAMLKRQPYLPRMTAGGPGNPLGARAMYIGGTDYRIHGTNNPETIGKNVSSGCIRLTNEDVIDLYKRVQVGAKVVVLPQTSIARASAQSRRAQIGTPVRPISQTDSDGTDAYAEAPAGPGQPMRLH
ncbi:MAG TPA: L,D-transpeptidase [Pseudolabrys sp.]|jgi:lipoprotein-anchoring transpeptidase ErfK/SrfK